MAKFTIPKVLAGWTTVVVEDEPDSREVARWLLQKAGAVVHTANNGREGLEAIRAHRPQFVLSDLSMPVMDGWQMMNELKADRRHADMPVIALTAHAMRGDRDRALANGFVNYLTKPLDPQKFIGQLLNLLVEIPAFKEQLSAQFTTLDSASQPQAQPQPDSNASAKPADDDVKMASA